MSSPSIGSRLRAKDRGSDADLAALAGDVLLQAIAEVERLEYVPGPCCPSLMSMIPK